MSPAAHGLSLVAGALVGPVALSVLARGAPLVTRAMDSAIERAAGLIGKTVLPLRRAGSHGQRLPSAEGGDADAGLNDVSPHDDALASAWYRSKVLPMLARRVLAELKESA